MTPVFAEMPPGVDSRVYLADLVCVLIIPVAGATLLLWLAEIMVSRKVMKRNLRP